MTIFDMFKHGAHRSGAELVERADSPTVAGFGNFGETCGFNLTNCPYVIRKGVETPLLDGVNRQKVLRDCQYMEGLIADIRDYDLTIPNVFPCGSAEAGDITLTKSKLTKTGKEPKYPAVIKIDTPEHIIEPRDWDAWIKEYSTAGEYRRELMDADFKSKRKQARKGSFVAKISYFASCEVGKADMYFWSEAYGWSFSFRNKGRLELVKAQRKRPEDSDWQVTFKR